MTSRQRLQNALARKVRASVENVLAMYDAAEKRE
jgi:hypothetical protein